MAVLGYRGYILFETCAGIRAMSPTKCSPRSTPSVMTTSPLRIGHACCRSALVCLHGHGLEWHRGDVSFDMFLQINISDADIPPVGGLVTLAAAMYLYLVLVVYEGIAWLVVHIRERRGILIVRGHASGDVCETRSDCPPDMVAAVHYIYMHWGIFQIVSILYSMLLYVFLLV